MGERRNERYALLEMSGMPCYESLLECNVPETHPLRAIDRFVRKRLLARLQLLKNL
jgi:hypothetical protein